MEGVREITRKGAKFVDGQEQEFDSIILATGYKSNVLSWLKVILFFLPKFCCFRNDVIVLKQRYCFRKDTNFP